MSVKISCIIPYYNVERELLRQCINSILHQDFQDYEVILVDDGSEEAYSAYLKEIESLDNRIKLIRQQNLGVSAARNIGVKYATGEYITFVDADDMVLPFFFSEAYGVAVENDADYVVGCVISLRSEDWETLRSQSPRVEIREPDQYRANLITIADRIQGGGYFGRGPVARLIKRTVLEQICFLESVKLGEDIIWNLDVVSNCEKIYMVYQIWYLYRKHPDSISYKYNADIISYCDQHLKELVKRIDQNNEKELIAYGNHIYELLRDNIYRCYLGRDECSLSVFKKVRIYHELSRKEPWTWYQTDLFFEHCDSRMRIKLLLIRTGLLYWYCCVFTDRKKRNGKE